MLDLFAGTGALGLEALSRGAASCVFIEESAEGRGLIRTNVEAFGLQGRTKIFRRDATKLGEAGTMPPFGLVFADPPYGKGLGEAGAGVGARRRLAGAGCALRGRGSGAGRAFRCPTPDFAVLDERDYGDTIVRFLEVARVRP